MVKCLLREAVALRARPSVISAAACAGFGIEAQARDRDLETLYAELAGKRGVGVE